MGKSRPNRAVIKNLVIIFPNKSIDNVYNVYLFEVLQLSRRVLRFSCDNFLILDKIPKMEACLKIK